MDIQLVQFYRQYLQQVQNPIIPPGEFLLQPDIQDTLYRYFFDPSRDKYLPGPIYQSRILQIIIDKIEKACKDPHEDQVSDHLFEHAAHLHTIPRPSIAQIAAEKSIISYFPPISFDANPNETPRILINEAKHILGSGNNVGLRTWEASLRLASYLYVEKPELIGNRNVLELGAGTGFLSIFCAAVLDANYVLATDGLEPVVKALQANIALNRDISANEVNGTTLKCSGGGEAQIDAEILDWTDETTLKSILDIHQLESSSLDKIKFNTVLGADITYHPELLEPLVKTLRNIAQNHRRESEYDELDILISSTERNSTTLSLFTSSCNDHGFRVSDCESPSLVGDMHDQKGLFHGIAMPIRILRLEFTDER